MKTCKNFLAAFAVFLLILTLIPSTVLAADYPKHENYIADAADILTEETISMIKDTNKALYGDYQLTIAVCTVKSTGNDDIGTYARNLFTNWKLGEGILILIAHEDDNYYFVPSVGMEDILSADVLASIRDEQFEADFSNGARERAVYKTVIKLKTTISAGMASRAAQEAAAAVEEETQPEEKGTTVGSVIVGIFKAILWIVLIAVLLFVGVFVWAMFNDDVAAILQKYLFRRKSGGRPSQNFYDDRLYGNSSRTPNGSRPQNPQGQRRPNPNGYGYGSNYGNGYPNQQSGYGRAYPQQNGYAQNPNNAGYLPQNQYPQQVQNPYGAQSPQQMPQGQQPMNNRGYGYPQQNSGYGQPMQQGYPQQNTGYYPQQGQYPQQTQNPNYSSRQGQQTSSDATVQFNIPKRN